MKKYALVLGGGGAKCSYQIGVWKVLRDLRIEFEAVLGTSAGALNGALIAQNTFREAQEIWENMTLDKVISIPSELVEDGKISLTKKNYHVLRKYRKRIVRNKGLDTDPMRNTVGRYLNEKKIRKSGVDFGLVTYELNRLKPLEIFIDKIPEGKLVDYLMASSGLPGFKTVKIDNRIYVDGGFYDNVPLDLARKRGYRRIIAVDVSSIGIIQKPDLECTDVIYIKNSVDLGGLFSFSPENSRRNMEIGRLDTMKAFGLVSGIRYFYQEDRKLMKKLTEILLSDDIVRECGAFLEIRGNTGTPAAREALFRGFLPEPLRKHKDLIVPFIECAAMALNIEIIRLYKMAELTETVRREFEKRENYEGEHNIKSFIKKLEKIDLFDIHNSSRKLIPEDLIVKDRHNPHLKGISVFFPELIPAKIFYLVIKKFYR